MREVRISEGLETVLHASIRSTSVVPLVRWWHCCQWKSLLTVVREFFLAVSLPSRNLVLCWRFCELPNIVRLTAYTS